ncbi:MAG: Dna2/Cas4 domain-containing protein [Candidatus Nealsonbacteria bacterium]|nr:Dna2/Cas4 domain-containing protein [Candidatus Nealsonbacteria bacterium]
MFLKDIIDKFYLDRQKDKEQHHFYITDAGKCGRALFFKFKNIPRKEMEANILRLFDHGDHIHQLIMKPLLSTREIHVVAAEVNIPPQELISGRADAIISDGKELYVLDIKSMNSMIFNKLDEPKEENIDQIQLYLHYFKIPKGVLLYVNKDNQQLKDFVVQYDKKRALLLLDTLKDVKKKIDKNIIPDRLADYPDNWQCRYCQFREVCSVANNGEMDWETFKKKIKLREENIRAV